MNQAVPIAAKQYAADQAKIAAFDDMRATLRRHLSAMDRLHAVASPNVGDWDYIVSRSADGLRETLKRVESL